MRRILEEQARLYLEAEVGRVSEGRPPACADATEGVRVQMSEEIRKMLEKVHEALALDLRTALQLIVADALPAWVLRAGKAQQQRQQALAQLENRLTPEMAAWEICCRLAHTSHAASLATVRALVKEGVISLELGPDASLCLNCDAGLTRDADHPGTKALQSLTEAGVLVPDGPAGGPPGRWKLEPQALLPKPEDRAASLLSLQRHLEMPRESPLPGDLHLEQQDQDLDQQDSEPQERRKAPGPDPAQRTVVKPRPQ
jgi:hypothetical protein